MPWEFMIVFFHSISFIHSWSKQFCWCSAQIWTLIALSPKVLRVTWLLVTLRNCHCLKYLSGMSPSSFSHTCNNNVFASLVINSHDERYCLERSRPYS